MKTVIGCLLAIGVSATLFGQGTTLWNEAVNGPLSNDFTQPTPLGVLQSGTNSVSGAAHFVRTGNGPGGTLYDDFVLFSVGDGFQVSAFLVQSDNPLLLWIGDAGFTSESASVFSAASDAPVLQAGLGLPAYGTYGFYISNRQFGSPSSVANYRLDFVVQAVPEPASLWILLNGLGFLWFKRWRRCGTHRRGLPLEFTRRP